LPCPFCLNKVILLSVCCDGSLFFNFAGPFDFGCCSLVQEMSFVVCYLPYFRQLITTCCWPSCLSSIGLLIVRTEIISLLFPLLWCAFSVCPFCCVLVFSSLFIVQLFFVCGGSVCPGAMLVYPMGGCGNNHVTLGSHLFGLPNVSHAGLEPAAGSGHSPPVCSV
jgi:hypothetical protein